MMEHSLQSGITYFQDQAYLDALIEFDCVLLESGEQAIILGWRGRSLSEMSYFHLDNQRHKLPEQYINTWISGNDARKWYGDCYREAKQSLDRALELEPDNAQLWQFLAEYYITQAGYHQGDQALRIQYEDSALKTIDRAIFFDPHNPALYKTKITFCERLYKYENGLESADNLVQLTPDDPEAWLKRGRLLNYLDRLEEALESYNHALTLTASDNSERLRRGYWGQGDALEKQGQWEKALESYDRALSYSGCIGAQRSHAEDLRHRLAIRDIERELESKPLDCCLWEVKAQRHFNYQDYDKAKLCYDRILELQPERADILQARSTVLLQLGETETAEADIEAALRLEPDNEEFWHQKGQVLSRQERFLEAIACYDRVLQVNPNHIDALYNSAQTLIPAKLTASMLEEQMMVALKRIDLLISLVPELSQTGYQPTSIVWYVRGLILIDLKRYEEARLSHLKANRLLRDSLEDPEEDKKVLESLQMAAGWYHWGHYLICNGYENYREAAAILERVLELEQGHNSALSFYAYALLNLERYEGAVEYYERALSIAPEEDKDWHNLAVAQNQLGRYEEAFSSYSRALTLKGEDFKILTNRARVLERLGRYEEAWADCDRSLALKPNYEGALYTKASILVKQGDIEGALANLKEYADLINSYRAYSLVYNYGQRLREAEEFAPLRHHPEFQTICNPL